MEMVEIVCPPEIQLQCAEGLLTMHHFSVSLKWAATAEDHVKCQCCVLLGRLNDIASTPSVEHDSC